MKTITYYQFMQWDGGDRHNSKEPAFIHKKDADRFLGDNSYDHFVKVTVPVYESLEEYEEVISGRVKAQALAKLTEVEKKALGLI